MSSPLALFKDSVNHTRVCALDGSIDRYATPNNPLLYLDKLYSENEEELGEKAKILSVPNSVPQTVNDPEFIVVARLYGFAPEVGIDHSWTVLLLGSRWASLFPAYSRNQQHLPDGSSVNDHGPLADVGIVHSVSKALA